MLFTHHKIHQNSNGEFEITLYLNRYSEEFSSELGVRRKQSSSTIEEEAQKYVRKNFPNTKINVIKIVGGAMLLTTLAFAPIKPSTAAAATPDKVEAQETYTVKAGDTLSHIAKRYGTTVQAIKSTNNLTSDFLRIGQILTIPNGTVTAAIPSTVTYTVVGGDTLSGIASRYGTTVDVIMRTNNLTSDFLRIGQTLTIPNGGSTSPTSTPTQTSAPTQTYTVVSGDTLSGIAARNGTTVNAIKTANNLTSDFLRIGQTLVIPGGSTSTAPTNTSSTQTSAPTQTYTVVSGDTLSGIAARNGTTVNAIKTANNLTSDFLRIGQTLVIPRGGTTTGDRSSSPAVETSVNQEELLWLARMIYAEARGESLQGQIAVGAVILNRVKSNLFPNTVRDVIFEKSHGHYQFTPAGTGSIHNANPTDMQMEAARRAMSGEDPTNGSLFFYNPAKTNDQWVRSRTVSTTIGNHVFAY
ncbi:LysM repeat protein [Evansella vedderi]|uniref:LysM repeat protein n=1 Tax=Evansella vedderi TaxID=38282 RepID=A0ABU0A019_9BACI|nr:LysM peptidoglycan-binding domain-containing protein [Evansella vedderi]MDQ0255685.1 LysM repeat protein [Evansella vedderi]